MSFIFGSSKIPPVEKIDPSEDARELRRRIAKRGGFQSTLLAGKGGADVTQNIFKQNLAGTRRKKRRA